MFARSNGAWTEQQSLTASNAASERRFGHSLALSGAGTVLVVGDPDEEQLVDESGAVYVFTHDGAQWGERALVRAAMPWEEAAFGASVSLNGAGDTLAVGAPDDSNVAYASGSVYDFKGAGASWAQQVELKAPHVVDDLQFGTRVALSSDGSTLAVGARGDSSAATGVDGNPQGSSAPLSGAVHVFRRDGVNWPHQAYLKASNAEMDDNFGRAVSLSDNGDTLVVGAPFERSTADGLNGNQASNGSSDVGAAYVFKRQGLAWRQRAYVKAPNSGGGDGFGMGLALSADGLTLAVGAAGEASSASGWNGAHVSDNDQPRSGAVYLY